MILLELIALLLQGAQVSSQRGSGGTLLELPVSRLSDLIAAKEAVMGYGKQGQAIPPSM